MMRFSFFLPLFISLTLFASPESAPKKILTYHPDGEVATITPLLNGKIHGEYLQKNQAGLILKSIYYQHGKRYSGMRTIKNSSGEVIEKTEYCNGLPCGITKEFYVNGRPGSIHFYQSPGGDYIRESIQFYPGGTPEIIHYKLKKSRLQKYRHLIPKALIKYQKASRRIEQTYKLHTKKYLQSFPDGWEIIAWYPDGQLKERRLICKLKKPIEPNYQETEVICGDHLKWNRKGRLIHHCFHPPGQKPECNIKDLR